MHIRKIAKKMMMVVFILVLVPMYDVSEYDVSVYSTNVSPIHISMYWRVYVCMCRLKYMGVFVLSQLSLSTPAHSDTLFYSYCLLYVCISIVPHELL
jgi:hypothetical protein